MEHAAPIQGFAEKQKEDPDTLLKEVPLQFITTYTKLVQRNRLRYPTPIVPLKDHRRTPFVLRLRGQRTWVLEESAKDVVDTFIKSGLSKHKQSAIIKHIYRCAKSDVRATYLGWELRFARNVFPNGFRVRQGWELIRATIKMHFIVHYWREKSLAPLMETGNRLQLEDVRAFENP